MKLLLDTHIFLWSFLQPERLTHDVAAALEGTDNEIWLSPITTWECLVLARKGRVRLLPEATIWLRERLETLGPREAHLNHEIAMESERIDLPHPDPADRFLAATAIVFDLILVTADDRLMHSKRFSVLANR